MQLLVLHQNLSVELLMVLAQVLVVQPVVLHLVLYNLVSAKNQQFFYTHLMLVLIPAKQVIYFSLDIL
jgi:hypothetical protein